MGQHRSIVANDHYQGSLWQYIEKHQIPISRSLLGLLYFCHFINPSIRQYTGKFIYLQYKIGTDNQGNDLYDIGIDDIYLVIYWLVCLTFLRSFLMTYVWSPIASNYYKMSKGKSDRYAEQSWSMYFAGFSFSYGFYIYYNSSYFFNMDNVYNGWPHDQFSAIFKTYYLLQIGFWLQQIFVLNVEKKRKDYIQMFSHHIITCLLLIGSYYYYFARIGHIILMLMDPVDVFLSGAKLLKYCGFNHLCDIMFILFLVSWIILRHILYNYVVYFTISYFRNLVSDTKCVEGIIQKRCWNENILNCFYSLLIGLQIITLIWLYFIFKVAYKVVTGSPADDVRSDSEDSDVEHEEYEEHETHEVEVEDEDDEKEDDDVEQDIEKDDTNSEEERKEK